MSSPIRAVIFDIGGVLVRTFDQDGRRRWEARLGLPEGGAEAHVLNSEMGRRAQRGEISDADLWAWVNETLRPDEGLDAFRRDFWGGDAVDRDLVGLIERLRPAYQTAALSNYTDALLDTLRGYELLDLFDVVVGSAYERVMKPDAAVYRRVLARLGREPVEAVFIDDSPANVAGARAVGLHAIHYVAGMDLEAELARLGVRPEPRPS